MKAQKGSAITSSYLLGAAQSIWNPEIRASLFLSKKQPYGHPRLLSSHHMVAISSREP